MMTSSPIYHLTKAVMGGINVQDVPTTWDWQTVDNVKNASILTWILCQIVRQEQLDIEALMQPMPWGI